MPENSDIDARRDKAKISKWLETQRGRPQYRAAPSVNRAVSRIMRPLSKQFGGGLAAIEPHWNEIIGPKFAKISRPVGFQSGSKGRQLIIRAPGPAGALIMAAQSQILDRINSYMGPGHVKSIKVIQGQMRNSEKSKRPSAKPLTPSIKRELQSGLDHIDDPDLKAALNKFGEAVYARQRKT